jgi:hypothetical protein
LNSVKGDLSNATTFKPPLFSLVNTFKYITGIGKKNCNKKIHLFYSPAFVPATPTAGIGTGGDGGFRRAAIIRINSQHPGKMFP